MTATAKLDISSLGQAIAQLEQSLEYYYSDIVQRDSGFILQLRAAAIQAFKFTYELSWKMLKRYLEMAEPTPGMIDEMSFPDLIRTACEQGLLLSDLTTWLKEAKYLHIKLQERIPCKSHGIVSDKVKIPR